MGRRIDPQVVFQQRPGVAHYLTLLSIDLGGRITVKRCPAEIAEMADTLGERIASLRHDAGLSQSQLAERAGISTATLRNWEQGIRYPLPVGLVAIAKGLGISPGPLLDGVTFPTQEKPGRAGRPRKSPPAASNASGKKPKTRKG
jgi:ribosome-binding protein aMBF1 (putative translation factor)